MNEIGWKHPVDDSGQWAGFNDSGIEWFRGNPIISFGREIIQNSSDAIRNKDKPVEVSFVLKHITASEFPGIEEYKKIISNCENSARKDGAKSLDFFQNAIKVINQKKIPVLCVDDFNTKGLLGPCEYGTPFHALLKSTGQSIKSSDDAGGSYGIGKNASFTVSLLRTIFVSTAYRQNNGKIKEMVQGKSILMSFVDEDKKFRRAVGFYGFKSGCMPLESKNDIPNWLRRPLDDNNEPITGTSIYVVGFREQKNWQELLTAAIAENFFGAIVNKQLRVSING